MADTVALIANVQQTGFYRVNYDQRNWQMLAELLLADHASVHRINRAQVRLVQNVTQKISLPNTQKCDTICPFQILNDAFDLARSGLLEYPTALATTQYLSLEQDYIPWEAALTG